MLYLNMTYNNVSSSWNISRDFGLKKATPYLREFSLSYSHMYVYCSIYPQLTKWNCIYGFLL